MLDELARTENLSVNQAELSYFVADQAQRMGVSPEYFARQLTESGQVGVAITEVLRGKAATVAAEKVKVTDEAGNEIDVKAQIEALNADVDAMLAAQAAAAGRCRGRHRGQRPVDRRGRHHRGDGRAGAERRRAEELAADSRRRGRRRLTAGRG